MGFLFGLVIAALGIVFIVMYNKQKKQNNRRTARVKAVCTNIEEKINGEEGNSITHYTLSYNVDGKDYTLSNLVGLPPKTEVGAEVTVRYNPQNPQDAGYDFGEAAKDKYLLYVGIGGLVLGILIMIIF